MLWPLLFALTLLVSLYDLRTHRIPNWVTLPLLVIGVMTHLSDPSENILISAILATVFASRWVGAGDVKLWLALVWLMPPVASGKTLLTMFGVFFITGLAQLVWRWLRRKRQTPITGVPAPAAWRTILFVGLLWLAH